jgi:hypothetical protein
VDSVSLLYYMYAPIIALWTVLLSVSFILDRIILAISRKNHKVSYIFYSLRLFGWSYILIGCILCTIFILTITSQSGLPEGWEEGVIPVTIMLIKYTIDWPLFSFMLISLSASMKEFSNLVLYFFIPVIVGVSLASVIVHMNRIRKI